MDLTAAFRERFSEKFYESDLPVEEFARQIGLTPTSVYRYLEGRHAPALAEIVKIADCFRCSADYLFGLADEYAEIDSARRRPFREQIYFLIGYFKKSEYAIHKETKISRSLIHSWKTGVTEPSAANLIKLAGFFKCSLDFVIGREK